MSINSVRSALPGVQMALSSKVNVAMLSTPQDYITTLRSLCRSATNQIILSALYLGNKGHEMDLLQDIESALKDASRPGLKVTFLLDHSRAGRGDLKSPSSIMMLSHLIDKYHPRCNLLLYQMPQTKGIFRQYLPTQVKEILGVYHCKFSLIDSTAILTGANLSEEYFVSRQDRYVLFSGDKSDANKGHRKKGKDDDDDDDDDGDDVESNSLVVFLSEFVNILEKYCHQVLPGGSIIAPTSAAGSDEKLQFELNNMTGYTKAQASNENNDSTDSSLRQAVTDTIFQPLIQHKSIGINQEEVGIVRLLTALCRYRSPSSSLVISSPYPSFSSPFMASLAEYSLNICSSKNDNSIKIGGNIQEEKEPLLSKSSKNLHSNVGESDSSSLNLSPTYIIIPSHSAHGFAKGTGLKALVPKLHTSAMLASVGYFWDHFKAVNDRKNIKDNNDIDASSHSSMKIKAFEQLNWTYHAKGIWHCERLLTDKNNTNTNNCNEENNSRYYNSYNNKGITNSSNSSNSSSRLGPGGDCSSCMCPISYIGSSNLGARSASRDFELGFVFTTQSVRLQALFGKECEDLLSKCPSEVHYLAERNRESIWIRLISGFLRSIL